MQCHRPTTGCTLYASADTPVIVLPGQGLVLGHVFSRSGTPLTHARQFPPCPNPGDLRRHILDNCWGAYLIVQADPTRADRLTFQRDPEGGMPCLHRIADGSGFVTAQDIAAFSAVPLGSGIAVSAEERPLGANQTVVPSLVGLRLPEAILLAENAGLKLTASGSGRILAQSLAPGEIAEKNSIVNVTLGE